MAGRMPRESFFLFGPRQTGKSTLLGGQTYLLAVDLLDPAEQLRYTKDPGLLAAQVDALPRKRGKVLIDEIQRAPALLDVVHALIEKYPALKFSMSGSSARRLRHGASNLLGGRALYRTLHPLTAAEMGKQFDLDTVLSFGSMPKIYGIAAGGDRRSAADFLRSYVITYLQEEIKAEALVRNLQGFQHFLDVAAAQFAEQVNFSDVGRSCGVAYATVREYYAILEDTLMGFSLPPCLRSMRKRMSHAPKFYFFDNGVTRAILGALQDPPAGAEKGRLFEQWFVQEVHRMNAYDQKDWKLSFWRTAHGAEVDLVIERGRRVLCAIECKYKPRIAGADLSGLKSFAGAFPDASRYVVASVPRPQTVGGVMVLPPLRMLETLRKLR